MFQGFLMLKGKVVLYVGPFFFFIMATHVNMATFISLHKFKKPNVCQGANAGHLGSIDPEKGERHM